MKKILIVDDEFQVREVFSEFLSINNFNVKTAADGLEGLKVFEAFKPDLAIVDVKMPNLDGLGFSKKILAKYPDFPIVIISAYIDQYDADEILDIGVREILDKPIDFKDLLHAVWKNLP